MAVPVKIDNGLISGLFRKICEECLSLAALTEFVESHPQAKQYDLALTCLQLWGAVRPVVNPDNTEDSALTPIGEQMIPFVSAGWPCHLARMLVTGLPTIPQDLVSIVSISAGGGGKSLCWRPPANEPEACHDADASHARLAQAREGYRSLDLARLLGAYDKLKEVQADDPDVLESFCKQRHLSLRVFLLAIQQEAALRELLCKLGMEVMNTRTDETALIVALFSGLCHQLVSGDSKRRETVTEMVTHFAEETILISSGSTCKRRADEGQRILLPLCFHSARPVVGTPTLTVITDAIDLSDDIWALFSRQGLIGMRAKNLAFDFHYGRVKQDAEIFSLNRQKLFTQIGLPAPAGEETSLLLALALLDQEIPFGDGGFEQPILREEYRVLELFGVPEGSFAFDEEEGQYREPYCKWLASRLAGATTVQDVMNRRGELIMTLDDLGEILGHPSQQFQTKIQEVEAKHPLREVRRAIFLAMQRKPRPLQTLQDIPQLVQDAGVNHGPSVETLFRVGGRPDEYFFEESEARAVAFEDIHKFLIATVAASMSSHTFNKEVIEEALHSAGWNPSAPALPEVTTLQQFLKAAVQEVKRIVQERIDQRSKLIQRVESMIRYAKESNVFVDLQADFKRCQSCLKASEGKTAKVLLSLQDLNAAKTMMLEFEEWFSLFVNNHEERWDLSLARDELFRRLSKLSTSDHRKKDLKPFCSRVDTLLQEGDLPQAHQAVHAAKEAFAKLLEIEKSESAE